MLHSFTAAALRREDPDHPVSEFGELFINNSTSVEAALEADP
jgi:hypothetical protein